MELLSWGRKVCRLYSWAAPVALSPIVRWPRRQSLTPHGLQKPSAACPESWCPALSSAFFSPSCDGTPKRAAWRAKVDIGSQLKDFPTTVHFHYFRDCEDADHHSSGGVPWNRPTSQTRSRETGGWSLGTWTSYQRQPPVTYILGGGSDSPRFPKLPQSSSPKEDQVLNTQACWCVSESNSVQVLVTLKKRVDGCFHKGDREEKKSVKVGVGMSLQVKPRGTNLSCKPYCSFLWSGNQRESWHVKLRSPSSLCWQVDSQLQKVASAPFQLGWNVPACRAGIRRQEKGKTPSFQRDCVQGTIKWRWKRWPRQQTHWLHSTAEIKYEFSSELALP